MATTYLSRTTGAPTSAKKFTISGWFKLAFTDTSDHQFFQTYHDSNNREHMYFSGNDLRFYCVDGGSTAAYLQTERKFRDNNAWYHIVIACDTTQGTAADRMKMYINGVQETDFVTETYPAQDFTFRLNTNAQSIVIGRYMGSNDFYYDGIISHYHFIDGTQYAASDFGSFDNTTGEWKINPAPNVTYGNNGWFLFKDNASVTDQSGVGNNWTTTAGTVTKTEDNPSNIFATINPLYKKPQSNPSELTNGNTGVIGGSAHRADAPTIAVNKGKWYMEAKAISGNTTKWWWGLGKVEVVESKQSLGNTDNFIYGDVAGTQGVYSDNLRVDGSTAISSIFSGAIAANDIAMIAVDLDNQKVWYGLNGTWNNGSASQSSTFNSSSPDSTALTAGEFYYIGVGNENTKWHTNYGNGYFGTTAVSSAGTNASNLGIFEYDVPAGFTAICTKGLNL